MNLSYKGNTKGLMEYLENIEVKCEIKKCGAGLNRIEVYGRNICDRCEEKLISA